MDASMDEGDETDDATKDASKDGVDLTDEGDDDSAPKAAGSTGTRAPKSKAISRLFCGSGLQAARWSREAAGRTRILRRPRLEPWTPLESLWVVCSRFRQAQE